MSFSHGVDKLKGERETQRLAASGRLGKEHAKKAKENIAIKKSLLHDDMMADEVEDEDDEEDMDDMGLSPCEQLLENIEMQLAQLDVPGAKQTAEEAMKLATSDDEKAQVFDAMAQILLDEGIHVDEAVGYFKQAETLAPGSSFERCSNLGQLTQTHESLHYYQQGLNLLEQQICELGPKRKGEDPDVAMMRAEFMELAANIMCSIGDLYMTDLCDEENAEKECTRFLSEAIKIAPTNIDALRTIGNLRMIQGNKQQAIKHTKDAYQHLINAVDQGKPVPEFLSRTELAKQLYELQLWSDATELFCALLDEDEQIGELWLYAGVSSINLAKTIKNKAEAHDLLFHAAQYFHNCARIIRESPDPDMQAEIDQNLAMLKSLGIDIDAAKKALTRAKTASSEEGTLDDIVSDDEEEMN